MSILRDLKKAPLAYAEVRRDGFASKCDRFYALPGRVERKDGDTLKDMFLPTMTSAAQTAQRKNQHFIRGQLQHYGISYNEDELSNDAVPFFQNVLGEGKVHLRSPWTTCKYKSLS